MKTATRALILASLFGAGCSASPEGELGNPNDPAVPGVPSVPGQQPPGGTDVPSVTPPGGTATPGVPGVPGGPGTTPTSTPPGTNPPPPPNECVAGVPVTSQIPRLTNLQYDTVVRDVFGVTSPDGSWSSTFEADSKGELTSTQWAQYKSAASKIADAVMGTALGTELTTAAASKTTLEASIRQLGRKALRRPLSDAEVAGFASLYDVEPQGTAAQVAKEVVFALLVSPSFLMRTELDAPEEQIPGTNTTGYKLSSHEVAARLSFLIWNSVPDDVLDAAADADQLQTKEQIKAQAERMLGAEFQDKVAPVVAAANRFYAGIDETLSSSRWGKTTHDKSIFPEFDDAQIAASLAELDRFFADVSFSGQFEDLFLSNVAYVNKDTASIYEVDGNFGAELQRVELDATDRPGFLTRAAFLNSFAHTKDTSPILRGVYILGLMGTATGGAAPDFDQFSLPDADYKTNREAVTALTSVRGDCVACHQAVINPPGFVMERYSATGKIQTVDPNYGGEIDTKVDAVPFPDGPAPVNDPFELMTKLALGRQTKEIYGSKFVSFATGRDPNGYDLCTAMAIADAIESGTHSNLAGVLADITQADSFRLRVAAQ